MFVSWDHLEFPVRFQSSKLSRSRNFRFSEAKSLLNKRAGMRHLESAETDRNPHASKSKRGDSRMRRVSTLCVSVVFVVSLISAITYGRILYRWQQTQVTDQARYHGAPMTFFKGYGKNIPMDTHLFWISITVIVLSAIVLGNMYFRHRRYSQS